MKKKNAKSPARFQSKCIGLRKRHRWNLEDRCEFCGAMKVGGAQRMAEWRDRHQSSFANTFVLA